MKAQSFYIIDGHSQIFRALYAKGEILYSPTGEVTSGIFFFLRMLLKLVRERKPDYLVVALDTARSELKRREWYPAYKANRDSLEKVPEEFLSQFSRIRELVVALGIPVVRVRGWEADDVIASIIKQARRMNNGNYYFYIVSRDKDLHQLVGASTVCYDPMDEMLWDCGAVIDKWGVPPAQLEDFFVLAGDRSDNVKGVPGIGPKRASALLREYGSLTALLEELHQGKLPELWEKFKGVDVPLLRKLIRLNANLGLATSISSMKFNGLNYKAALPVFKELGFKRIIRYCEQKVGSAV